MIPGWDASSVPVIIWRWASSARGLWAPFHVMYFEGGATLFHLAINLTSALVAGLVLSFNLPFMIAYGVIAALVAAAVVFVRRELFFSKFARSSNRGWGI